MIHWAHSTEVTTTAFRAGFLWSVTRILTDFFLQDAQQVLNQVLDRRLDTQTASDRIRVSTSFAKMKRRSSSSMTLTRMLVVLLALGMALCWADAAGLKVGFYATSCPKAEQMITAATNTRWFQNFDITPGLMRIYFHDCFVRVSISSSIFTSRAWFVILYNWVLQHYLVSCTAWTIFVYVAIWSSLRRWNVHNIVYMNPSKLESVSSCCPPFSNAGMWCITTDKEHPWEQGWAWRGDKPVYTWPRFDRFNQGSAGENLSRRGILRWYHCTRNSWLCCHRKYHT